MPKTCVSIGRPVCQSYAEMVVERLKSIEGIGERNPRRNLYRNSAIDCFTAWQ